MKKIFFISKLFLLSICLKAQTIITGRVIDTKTGEPVPCASIGIKGKTMGTLSTETGHFSITVSNVGAGDSLKVSSIGYISRSFPMAKAQQFQNEPIYLTQSSVQLDEVVVKPSKTYTLVLGNKKYNKK